MKTQLLEMNACREAVEWVGDRDLATAWAECERGDWMLWLVSRLNTDCKLLVLAACDCAEQSLKYVPVGEDRPANALAVARAWCSGQATLKQVVAAANTAYAAANASYAAARKESLHASAELIRLRIPVEVVAELWGGGEK